MHPILGQVTHLYSYCRMRWVKHLTGWPGRCLFVTDGCTCRLSASPFNAGRVIRVQLLALVQLLQHAMGQKSIVLVIRGCQNGTRSGRGESPS